MKNAVIKLCLIIILFGFNMQLVAQSNDTVIYNNEFRLGVVQSFLGTAHINYERFFWNDKHSFVGISELTYNKRESKDIYGFMGGLQYRYYLFTYFMNHSDIEIVKGYLSPGVKYRERKIIEGVYNDQIISSGYEFLLGLKYMRFYRFIIDINFGVSVNNANVYTKRQDRYYIAAPWLGYNYGYSGVSYTGNITCGFNF